MQCYTELIPPSGVTHAVWLSFTSATASNLVVARTSLLQVFSHTQANNGNDTKLVLLAEYSLAGTITSLGRVKLLKSKSGGEGLLVSLRNAKLSLMEWNPEQHIIATISIHYYESEDLRTCPWDPELRDCVSHLTVDPSSRCAAFNFGNSKLAILPFHQPGDDLVMDEYDSLDEDGPERSPDKITNGDAEFHNTPYESSFVWPLTKLDSGLLHPVHIAFLHEYRKPTISVLYSTTARSSALHSERKDVTTYAAYELDVEQKTSQRLIHVQKLPDDLFKIVPLPLPVGGALLIGYNEIVHVEQSGKTNAISVNEFAKQNSSFPMTDQSHIGMRLEDCQVEQLGQTNGDMLMVLATGEMAVLSFRIDGRSVSGISIRRVLEESQQTLFKGHASCMAATEMGRLFVGSEESESVLLNTVRKSSQLKKHSSRANLTSMPTSNGDMSEAEDDEEEDEDDLYGESTTQANAGQSTDDTSAISSNNLRILDRLQNIAPIRDVALGRPAKRRRFSGSEEKEPSGTSDLELLVASGSGRAGGISLLSREIKPVIRNSSKHVGVNGVWSLPRKSTQSVLINQDEESPVEFVIMSKANDNGQGESHLYIASDGELVEKGGTEFDVSAGETIEVGSIAGGGCTVQVLESEVRVYDAGKSSYRLANTSTDHA